MGGSELAFQQQGSVQVFASGVHGQDSSSVDVMGRGSLDADYPLSSNHNRDLPDADGYPSLRNSNRSFWLSPSL